MIFKATLKEELELAQTRGVWRDVLNSCMAPGNRLLVERGERTQAGGGEEVGRERNGGRAWQGPDLGPESRSKGSGFILIGLGSHRRL